MRYDGKVVSHKVQQYLFFVLLIIYVRRRTNVFEHGQSADQAPSQSGVVARERRG